MGRADNKFSEARVLRSNDTILTYEELWLLFNNLSQPENTFDDLEKLRRIFAKLDEATEGYMTEADEFKSAFEHTAAAFGLQTEETAKSSRAAYLFSVNNGQSTTADVILRMSEYNWIKDRLGANKKLAGSSSKTLNMLLRIKEAVDNAKGVRYVGNPKTAWIEGEEAPSLSGQEPSLALISAEAEAV